MTANPHRPAGPDDNAGTDAVTWVRRIRDAMYDATATFSAEELIGFVRHAAATTDSAIVIAPPTSGAGTA